MESLMLRIEQEEKKAAELTIETQNATDEIRSLERDVEEAKRRYVILYCIVLYCVVLLYCIVLYCIVRRMQLM